MLKGSKAMRIWEIIYPVLLYYAVTLVALYILDFFLPETADTKLLRQLLTSLAVLPFLYSFYRQDQKMRGKVFSIKTWSLKQIPFADLAAAFFAGGCFALAWNNVLGVLRIQEYSSAYTQVEETFYMGKILLEIVALCIVIPLAEELLYRGIVYGRLKDWLLVRYAAVISAVIFGLVHMNLVQFIYAAVFGLLLAYFAEMGQTFFTAAAAHMAANLTSVLRAETSVFAFMDTGCIGQIVITAALFLAAVSGILWFLRRDKK